MKSENFRIKYLVFSELIKYFNSNLDFTYIYIYISQLFAYVGSFHKNRIYTFIKK